MLQSSRPRRAVEAAFGLLLMIFAALAFHGEAGAQTPVNAGQQLQLEVSINGNAVHIVTPFQMGKNGRLSSARSELTELGIKVPGKGRPGDAIALDSIPGLTYAYDEPHQAIDIRVRDEGRVAKTYDGRGQISVPDVQPTDWGLLLNYDAYAVGGEASLGGHPLFEGSNLTLGSVWSRPTAC